MTPESLLAELRRSGVTLSVDADQLRVRAARGVLTPALQQALALHKPAILELLAREAAEADAAPFPLTAIQQAYLVGRTATLGVDELACHLYQEFDAPALDLPRLAAAWTRLLARHEMLRAVVAPDGTQRVTPGPPRFELPVLDLRGRPPADRERALDELRARLSTRMSPIGAWPTFDLRATLLDDRVRVHLDFDLITADAAGLLLLLAEWGALYRDPDLALPPPPLRFRDYLLHERAAADSPADKAARAYWFERLDDLPPAPELPLARDPATLHRPPFRRLAARLDPERWTRLRRLAGEHGLTPAGIVCAAFAEVLAAFAAQRRFTLNLTLFLQRPVHPDIHRVVGDFTTTLLLACDNDAPTLVDRARALQAQLGRDLEHAACGGVTVLRERARRLGAPEAALMPVVFTGLIGHSADAALEWLGEQVHAISQTPHVWLDHQVREQAGALHYSWDSPVGLFPPGLLEDAFAAFTRLLRRLADDPDAWQRASLVPELLPELAARDAAYNADDDEPPIARRCLHDLARAPDPARVAVLADDRSLARGELERRSAALARQLLAAGARPDALIAVVARPGWQQIVAVLAILRAGAAYVPIDPELPAARREFLLARSEAALLVREAALRDLPWPASVRVLEVEAAGDPDGPPPAATPRPDDLAYVLYTSGSTGAPRGVMIAHHAAANTVQDMVRRFAIGPDDRLLMVSGLGFDLSVFDIFAALAVGAPLVTLAPGHARDPEHWRALIDAHRVSIWNSVPALCELLVELLERHGRQLPSLRLVLLSGDWVPVDLPDRVRRVAPNAVVLSLGGATEAAIWSIWHPTDDLDPAATSVPYGRPLAHQRLHVLDDRLESRPTWVPGDLYIAGEGLARGYWRDEPGTRERFIDHPRTGERLYRTGDLGRFLPAGVLEFLGRRDLQVKLQGHRVELAEIDAALRAHPDVAAALASVIGPRDRRRLCAHVVRRPGADALDAPALLAHLRAGLPAHMLPSAVVFLRELPRGANGKLDRRALPPPPDPASTPATPATLADAEHLAAVTALVAEIVPGLQVRPDTVLLQAGASSIDLIRLATRLNEHFGFRPSMAEILRLASAAEIAAYYAEHARRREPDRVAALTPTTDLLIDPDARAAFKAEHRGLRRLPDERPAFPLAAPAIDPGVQLERATSRNFAATPLPAHALGHLLAELRPLPLSGGLKYRYASAGGAYGVQVHVHVAAGRITELPAGAYYHDPRAHRLVRLSSGDRIDASLHIPGNRPIFAAAAFSLLLVADRRAIEPLYGDRWRDFALIEAGLICQLLELAAPRHGVGLCQIGDLRGAPLRAALDLDDAHELIHSLVGGPLAFAEDAL